MAALVLPQLGLAQAPATFTLRDAVTLSLKQSPALQVEAEAIEQKSGLLEQASGEFDWIGTGAATVSRQRTPVIGAPGTSPVEATTQENYTVGIDKEFRNGISISPSASVTVNGSQSPYAPTYAASQVGFVINVPLLRGLGTDSTGAAEAAARGDVEVARLLYQSALAAQALSVASNYWACRAADETLDVQADVERGAEKLVASTKVLVDSRVFAPAFLLQAEANLRDKRSARIDAELTARTARIALGQSLGLPPKRIASTPRPENDFPKLGDPLQVEDENSRNALIDAAIASRPDMQASRASVVPLNLLARRAEIDLKPQANLTLSSGYAGLSAGASAFAPLGQRIAGPNSQIGLSYSWPFHNSLQSGLLRQRRADVRVAEAQAEDFSRQVATDVLTALETVRLRAEGVRSARETVDLAKRALAAQYESLKAGTSTILDVIQLENLSAAARINYVSAYAAYATAIAQLRYSLGTVFAQPNPSSEAFMINDLSSLPGL